MRILVARTRLELKNKIASLKSTLEDADIRPRVGFVPTMGALHEGHASLIRKSAKENSITVVSIFVNPKQFGQNEDLTKYPRTFESDCDLARMAGAQIVYAPSVEEMYPTGFATQVQVENLSNVLCGAYRPGHFSGVCTVVLLLLNLVNADKAYFGLKDFQQFAIIARMVNDLEHPTRVIGVPTVREHDGLALSSRNRFLDASARKIAACIPMALRHAADGFLNGIVDPEVIVKMARDLLLNREGFELQYCELRDAKTLSELPGMISNEVVLAVAGFASGEDGVRTRLIDNVLLTHEPEHLETLLDFVHKRSREQ